MTEKNSAPPTSNTVDSDQPRLALAWMTLSALSFSLMAIFVKRMSPSIPQFELVFFRSFINLIWISILMGVNRENFFPPGKPLLIFRGIAGFAGVSCLFYSIGHLALPIATLLGWCSPIFVILFSRLILKERLSSRSIVLIPLAFLGLLLLLIPPQAGVAHRVSLVAGVIGVLGAAFAGMAYVAVRVITARVGANAVVFYFSWVSTLLAIPFAIPGAVLPSGTQWIELLCLGSFATVGQIAMTRGYRHAPAGIVSMMSLLNPVFGATFGLLLFGEVLHWVQWSGMLLVGAAIAGLTWSSRLRRSVTGSAAASGG